MIVDCAHYCDGRRQHDGPMDLDRAATIYKDDRGGFVWLGLFEPSLDELQKVQARFGLHDLAIEDAQNLHLRPKVEQYSDGAISFVVLRTARYIDETEEIEFGEVSVFTGPQFVITVRQGAASELHGARTRLEQRPDLLAEGPDAALWAVMDKIVDDYLPVVQCLEQDIGQLEESVFTGSVAPSERIYSLRREATEFYRAVHPLLAPLDAIARGTQLHVSSKLRPFFRDINDHLKLTEEEIASQRELLAVMLQANLAVISLQQNQISVRQNETSKQLTVIATVFLPLTFITGFFGMNFEWLTSHDQSETTFVIWGVGTLIVSLVALGIFFKHRGWFGTDAT
ncbi:MAG: magnesium and cobalt transport protein CorA [Solirubrobacteraceae bacterium]